jgi:phosphatidylglycerophosphate synthase
MEMLLATLWPAYLLMIYFSSGLALFVLIGRRNGRGPALPALIDREVNARPDSKMLGRFLRHYIMWMLAPWQRALVRSGLTPNVLTFASLLAAGAAAVAVARGSFAAGGWLYFLCGILDILDGRVARVTGRVSPSGAFFDSVIDRYAELVVFAGLAYYYRDSPVLGVVLLASLGSVMVSYTRARGEALGISDLNIGTMQRPERLFYLGMSMIWSPIVELVLGHGRLPPHPLVVGGLMLLGVSANITAVRRIRHTMARLDAASIGAPAPTAPATASALHPRRETPLVVALKERRAS